MPYIITTHRHLDDPAAEFLPGAAPGVARRAVATLEEALKHARECVWLAPNWGETRTARHIAEVDGLPESGGTVGPLPDGTVIEVESVAWDVLRERADMTHYNASDAAIIDAYNAKHTVA